MAISQSAAAELTKVGLGALRAPFFTTWVHTAFMIFVLPSILIIEKGTAVCGSVVQPSTKKIDMWDDGNVGSRLHACGLRWHVALPSARPRCCKCIPPLLLMSMCFYVLWMSANYCYSSALTYSSAGIVTAVFSSCSAFVAILSRLVLNERMCPCKVTSVLLAVAGVCMLGLIKAGSSNPAMGVLLGLGSSISAVSHATAVATQASALSTPATCFHPRMCISFCA